MRPSLVIGAFGRYGRASATPYRSVLGATRRYGDIDTESLAAVDAFGNSLAVDVSNPLTVAPELDATRAQPANNSQPPALPVREELRYGSPLEIPLSLAAVSTRVLLAPSPNTRRAFLFIVNTHPLQAMFISFGQNASALSVPIAANGGSIGFDTFVPQSDVYMLGAGAATTGVLIYANKGTNDYPELPSGGA